MPGVRSLHATPPALTADSIRTRGAGPPWASTDHSRVTGQERDTMEPQETNMVEAMYQYGVEHPEALSEALAQHAGRMYRVEVTPRIRELAEKAYQEYARDA